MASLLCQRLPSFLPAHTKLYHTTPVLLGGYKLHKNLMDCYVVLRLTSDCEDHEVRKAYLDLAKQYHPDSGSTVADQRKFAQVEEAYRTIVNHRADVKKKKKEEGQPLTDPEIDKTKAQHRQYLSYEGVGFGNPSQRQKQYQHVRMQRANDNVYEYKVNRVVHNFESALVTKDKQETRKRTIRNQMERLVEDLIQESLSKGEFDNLSGKGKPIDFTEHNPMVDTHTHNINKILINNGYVPEWILLEKEIRQDVEVGREKLWQLRLKAGPEPVSEYFRDKMREEVASYRERIQATNRKIDKFNMIVPSMRQQKCHYNVDKIVDKLFEEYREKIASGEIVHSEVKAEIKYEPLNPNDDIKFRDMWKDIKAFFTT